MRGRERERWYTIQTDHRKRGGKMQIWLTMHARREGNNKMMMMIGHWAMAHPYRREMSFFLGGGKKVGLVLGYGLCAAVAVPVPAVWWLDGTFKLRAYQNQLVKHVMEHVIKIPHKCHIFFLNLLRL